MSPVGTHLRSFLTALAFGGCGLCAMGQNDPRMTALSLEKQGKNAEAEAVWRSLAKEYPSSPEPLAHMGLLEARQEHYTDAVAFYRKALLLNPEMPGLRLNMGLALFKDGEYKEAILLFEPMLNEQPASSPESQRLTLLLGMSYYGLGEYVAATPYLQRASAEDAQNLTLLLTLAHGCLLSKQFPCVLDAFHRIVTLNAESAEADMLAGEALDEMKNTAGATVQFRAAVKADPKEPDVHFGLGYLLWGLMQYDEAAQEFQAELGNNPDHAQALAYLADTNMRLNHPEAAPPLLAKAIRIDPRIELAHLDLGILDADAGHKEDALRELKIAEKLSPDDQNVHWRLARFFQASGRKDEAKVEFDKTRSLQRADDATVFRKLHEAQEKGKSAEEAPDASLSR